MVRLLYYPNNAKIWDDFASIENKVTWPAPDIFEQNYNLIYS